MKKYTKEELYEMDVVELYEMVLKGDVITRFPRGYWQQPRAKENAVKCTRYLIEDILKYDEIMIKQKASQNLFYEHRLFGMLYLVFNHSPYEAINNAYPGKYKEWEFKSVPNGYWRNRKNGMKATKWLVEEKLKLNDKQLKQQLSAKLFIKNGLNGMLQLCFNNSPYEAINSIYPNKYKEWEFKQVPHRFWESKENGIKATKWLIEEKLKLNDEQLKEQLSLKLFIENNLSGMLQICFNNSPYKAINSTYPNKYIRNNFKPYKK